MRLGVPGTAAFQGGREDEEGLGTARIRGDLTWHAEVCCPQMRGSEGPQRAGEFSVLCGPSEAVYTSLVGLGQGTTWCQEAQKS